MDKATKRNVILGLFVIIGIVLFIIGIFLVGSKNEIFKDTFQITAKFSNATGLKPGSNVRYNGVKVGIVKSVSLINDSMVQVDMSIEESKRKYLTKSIVATIVSDGLMGDKMVNITTGYSSKTVIQNNDTILSKNPIMTDEIFRTLTVTNENVKVVTENLKTITSNLNTDSGLIQSLYKDPALANNLKESFSNLKVVTRKVAIVSDNLQSITSKIEHGNGAIGQIINDTVLGRRLTETINSLNESSAQLNDIASGVATMVREANTGKGTAALILKDTTFASDIQQSVINIKNASDGLNQNMEAMKHSIFFRKYFRKKARSK
jgi:phospholipid/cholesterol/gamma-HCH transport system substrate-binding protein